MHTIYYTASHSQSPQNRHHHAANLSTGSHVVALLLPLHPLRCQNNKYAVFVQEVADQNSADFIVVALFFFRPAFALGLIQLSHQFETLLVGVVSESVFEQHLVLVVPFGAVVFRMWVFLEQSIEECSRFGWFLYETKDLVDFVGQDVSIFIFMIFHSTFLLPLLLWYVLVVLLLLSSFSFCISHPLLLFQSAPLIAKLRTLISKHVSSLVFIWLLDCSQTRTSLDLGLLLRESGWQEIGDALPAGIGFPSRRGKMWFVGIVELLVELGGEHEVVVVERMFWIGSGGLSGSGRGGDEGVILQIVGEVVEGGKVSKGEKIVQVLHLNCSCKQNSYNALFIACFCIGPCLSSLKSISTATHYLFPLPFFYLSLSSLHFQPHMQFLHLKMKLRSSGCWFDLVHRLVIWDCKVD